MQNLRKLNIFQIYRRLPFIVYKSAYLIPQRPFPPTSTESLTPDLDEFPASKLLDSLIEKQSGKVGETLRPPESPAQMKQLSQHEALLSEYISFYILPLYKVKRGVVALRLYAEDNVQQLKKLSRRGDTVPQYQISQHYSSLPIEARWPYQQRAAQILAANQIQFQTYQKLFEIPQPKQLRPLELYLEQCKVDKKQKQSNELSRSQKQRLAQLSIKLGQKDKQTLTNFLQEYNLTISQFNIIKQICEKTAKCSHLHKQYLNNQKQYQNSLKSGNNHRVKTIKKDSDIALKEFQKLSGFISTIPKDQLKTYHQVLSLPLNCHFKKGQFSELCKQLKYEKIFQVEEKPLETNQLKLATKIEKQPFQQQQSTPTAEPNTHNAVLFQTSIGEVNQKIETQKPIQLTERPTLLAESPISPQLQQPLIVEEPIVQLFEPMEKIQQYKTEEVAYTEDDPSLEDTQQAEAQLKDENLNDLDILEEDYEVLKLNRLIKKAGKPKIMVKRRIY